LKKIHLKIAFILVFILEIFLGLTEIYLLRVFLIGIKIIILSIYLYQGVRYNNYYSFSEKKMGKFKLINSEMLFGMIVFFIGLETIRKDLIYSNQIFTFLNFYHFYLIPIMLVFSIRLKKIP
jgi:hypothetical protein